MSRKIGRNDPCRCGSGRKYKRCCLAADEARRLKAARQPSVVEPDDDGSDDFDDEYDTYVPEDADVPAFDFSALSLIGYTRGFVDAVDQIESGEGLRVTEWRAPDIPRDVLDSLARERLDEIDGPWGNPDAAAPIQVDIIYLRTPDDEVIVDICNRAHLLLTTRHEGPRRLDRACVALEAAADRGVEVPFGESRARVAEAGPPAFPLDEALKAHRMQRGTCELCGADLTSAGASRHLAACAPRYDTTAGPRQELIHLRITAPGLRGYWLDAEVRADVTLSALDGFLRATWVECCGHLSLFEIDGIEYASQPYDDPLGGMFRRRPRQHSLNAAIGKALSGSGGRFTYKYDFGSTTRLQLVVKGTRVGRIGRPALQLLARNQPLEWPCATCGGPATSLCSECIHESENPFVCTVHADEHPCGADALVPIVNSPRMGVCGYA